MSGVNNPSYLKTRLRGWGAANLTEPPWGAAGLPNIYNFKGANTTRSMLEAGTFVLHGTRSCGCALPQACVRLASGCAPPHVRDLWVHAEYSEVLNTHC
jgi:hypothetical protein